MKIKLKINFKKLKKEIEEDKRKLNQKKLDYKVILEVIDKKNKVVLLEK